MSAFPQNFGIGFAQMVWLFSGFTGFNQFRTIGYPAYLSLKQQARLERMRQARMLHDGRHADYFLFEGRTQFDFPVIRSEGRVVKPYVPYNLLKLISQKGADLLFGSEPAVKVENAIQSDKLAELAERTSLHRLLYHSCDECGVDGEAVIEAVVQGGQTYLKRVDAADLFPEGPIQADGQYKSYVRYNARNLGDDQKPDWILLTTRYLPGRITRTLQKLDGAGRIVPQVLTLNQWPQEDPEDDAIEPETLTGIDRNTITWIPNLITRDIPVSDYDGLIEQQDLLNAKRTQLARVLAQHADPAMAFPRDSFKDDGNIEGSYKAYPMGRDGEKPEYITWDAELEAAMADFQEVRSAMLLMSETSPVLLGIKDSATAHVAYKSVRLEATNSLTKAQRKAVIWRAAIKRMLSVAQDLDQTIPGNRYDRQPVGVEMNDGLPIDTDQQATEISTLRTAGVMSVERAVEILIPDPAARDKELAALAAERAAATPSILMGEPGQGGADQAGAEADAEENDPGDVSGEPAAAGVGVED